MPGSTASPRPPAALAVFAIMAASFAAPSARADLEEVDWIVGASAGYSVFEFKPKIDSSLSFPTVSVSAGASWRRLYATVAYGASLADADASEEDFTGRADRRDLDLTVGWQANDWFGVFAGWKDGSTRLDLDPRGEDDAPTPASVKERYGIFSLSVAYAMLDAENLFVADGDGADPGEDPEFDDLTGSVNGDSRGFSYGLSWTQPLGAELLYRAQLKLNDYEQELDFGGLTFDDLDQRFVSFTMGLSYVF